jgi:hypothetical protein
MCIMCTWESPLICRRISPRLVSQAKPEFIDFVIFYNLAHSVQFLSQWSSSDTHCHSAAGVQVHVADAIRGVIYEIVPSRGI